MLNKFLEQNRAEILLLSEQKTKNLAGFRGKSDELSLGLPLFFDQLITVLDEKMSNNPSEDMIKAAAVHGKEFLRLGYSLAHVVHAYGAMCQSITELAGMKNAEISAEEFQILNGCLDVAIASAVSEYHFTSVKAGEELEVKHLGFLAHELRNALSSIMVAHDMIKAGLVGTGGSTSRLLESNIVRMRNLIDRSLSEVRMRSDADLFIETFRLSDLFDQIIMTAQVDANKKYQTLTSEVDVTIELQADRQFIMSALANLVQNAIKYSKLEGVVILRAKLLGERVIIEVQDECGGIDPEKITSLFEPYVKASTDKSGLGLGLAIAQRAISLSQGTISVTNSGSGCCFVIDIPQRLTLVPTEKTTVSGKDSVQPDLRSKPKL
jgi:signal transduction histidine kinase